MGLFDMFGAGGGTATFELPEAVARCGQSFSGTVVFTAGKRKQKINGMAVWFVENDGDGEKLLWAPDKLPLDDEIGPGEVRRYPFRVDVPRASQTRVNGQAVKRYGLRASLDIPKEVDPQAKADIDLQGTLDAEVTVR